MLKETSINDKIKKYLDFSEKTKILNPQPITNVEKKFNKMEMISKCMDSHKKCLIDFSLVELLKIMNDFLIIKKLDTGRLLFLQRKVNKCKKILFMMVNVSRKPY